MCSARSRPEGHRTLPAAHLSLSKKLTLGAAGVAFLVLAAPPLLTSRVPQLAPPRVAEGLSLPVLPARAGQVSSAAGQAERRVEPLAVPAEHDAAEAFRRFERKLALRTGVRVVAREPQGYDRREEVPEWLHLEWVSPFWRLRGDVLLVFDVASRAIQVSASSRGPLPVVGLSRQRIEALRALLAEAP